MMRLTFSLAATCILLALIVAVADFRSDVGDIFGPTHENSLDSSIGRELVLALESPDLSKRNGAAREISYMLANEPLVERVFAGPEAWSKAFIDWVWERRFWFSPPTADDLAVDKLSRRLADARDALGQSDGIIFGDRLLRDPTGSFAKLLDRLRQLQFPLSQKDGIWQSQDNKAAIIFVTLTSQKFEAEPFGELAKNLRARAERHGVKTFFLGPRIVAAEISYKISEAARFAALTASGLLILWLAWHLRSGRRVFLTFVPLVLGVASATLAIQLSFGSVHVITIGFGGVLIGLGLDYPLHLLADGGYRRRHTERLIMIGAMTTAAGFLALLGSRAEVLMQIGLFVAIGISSAAIASWRIIPPEKSALRAPHMERLAWRLPYKPWVETAIILAGISIVASTSDRSPQSLFEPPGHIELLVARFAELLTLPSGQHQITIDGKSLDDIIARGAAIQPVVNKAIQEGWLDRFVMLAQWIAETRSRSFSELPAPNEYLARVTAALRENRMATSFGKIQTLDYRAALASPKITISDLDKFVETRVLKERLEKTTVGWRERVKLFHVRRPKELADAIAKADVPGVKMIDMRNKIETGLIELRQRVTLWLGIGALIAFAVLAFGLTDWRKALTIARTTIAAVSLTAAALTLTGGTVGIFQIVALTLVVGIGIDYGLFLASLDRREDPKGYSNRCRSVALCAGTTIIPFAVMSFASIRILQEIGLTVSMGVLILIVLNLAQSLPQRRLLDSR